MKDLTLTHQEKIQKLKEWFAKTRVDADVMMDTIGINTNTVSAQALLDTSAKLIKVHKGEVEPDDRDHLKHAFFMGLEDQIKEHIDKDAGKLQRKAKMKIEQKKDLSWLHSGFFSPQIRSTLIGNSLSQQMEGINPLEYHDVSHRVTKLGMGGIASSDSIPDSSRQVQESSFGFIDPYHVSESSNVGVTGYFSNNTAKGRDNKIYKLVKNNKSGKLEWVDHEVLLNSKVEIPEH